MAHGSTTIHLHALQHSQPFYIVSERERDCTSPRIELLCHEMKFSASDRNSCKEATGFDKETLQKAPLTFEITVCAAHDRTHSPVLPPPLLLIYSGATVRVHRAHIKANALHGSALAPAIKGFQRRYVCLHVHKGDLSVSARACMQMHQIKCNYTRRKFTLGLHPPLCCWCASFAQNSTSDKLHGEEKERSLFYSAAGGGSVESEFGFVCLLWGPLQSISACLQFSARQKLHYTQNVFLFLFGRCGSVPEAFGGIL
jgi:hypothetical protein